MDYPEYLYNQALNELFKSNYENGFNIIIKTIKEYNHIKSLNFLLYYLNQNNINNENFNEIFKQITLNELHNIIEKIKLPDKTYILYIELLFTLEDFEKYFKYIKILKDNNNPYELYFLGKYAGLNNNNKKMIELYNKACNNGCIIPYLYSSKLGLEYLNNILKKIPNTETELLAEIYYNLGEYYENNNNIELMYLNYKKSSDLYYIPSIFKLTNYLSDCYHNDIIFTEEQINDFIKYNKILINIYNYDDNGSYASELGSFLINYNYPNEAEEYLLKACEYNNILAFYNLGILYLDHLDNYEQEGLCFLNLALNKGEYNSLHFLSKFYYEDENNEKFIHYGNQVLLFKEKIDKEKYNEICLLFAEFYKNNNDYDNMVKYYKLILDEKESIIELCKYYYENKKYTELDEIIDIIINEYNEENFDIFFRDFKLSDLYNILNNKLLISNNQKITNYIQNKKSLHKLFQNNIYELKECVICYDKNQNIKLNCTHEICINCYDKMQGRCYYRCEL